MEVKKIVEGMTAVEVAEVIDSNFRNQNKILEEDIAKQNSVIGVSEYKDFSEAEAVNVGDVRKYEGFLYECVEATTGAFDAAKWKATSFKKETEAKLSELGSKVSDIADIKSKTVLYAKGIELEQELFSINKGVPATITSTGGGFPYGFRMKEYVNGVLSLTSYPISYSSGTHIYTPTQDCELYLFVDSRNTYDSTFTIYLNNKARENEARFEELYDRLGNEEKNSIDHEKRIDNLERILPEYTAIANDFSLSGYIDKSGFVSASGAANKCMILQSSNISKIKATIGGLQGYYAFAFYKDSQLISVDGYISAQTPMSFDVTVPNETNKIYIFSRNAVLAEAVISVAYTDSLIDDINNVKKIAESKEVKKLEGIEFFVLGDSLSAGSGTISQDNRKWMPRLVEISGGIFDLGYNYNSDTTKCISLGGTKTLQADSFSGQMRARKLLAEKQPSVIFYQNVNDLSVKKGDITDVPVMASSIVELSNVSDSKQLAESDFYSNLNARIQGITPLHGVIVKCPYKTNGSLLTISGTATKDGNLRICPAGVNGTNYGINVVVGDTPQMIVDKILEWNYLYYDDVRYSDNSVCFTANADSPLNMAVKDGDRELGITVGISQANDAISYTSFIFTSHNMNDWYNSDKWIRVSDVSLVSAYKGMIEYIMTASPNTKIYMLGFPNMSINYTSQYKRADGSFDWDAYVSERGRLEQELIDVQEEVSKHMRVTFIDVAQNTNINIYNANQFYPSSNVHPYAIGYDRFAEVIYSKL